MRARVLPVLGDEHDILDQQISLSRTVKLAPVIVPSIRMPLNSDTSSAMENLEISSVSIDRDVPTLGKLTSRGDSPETIVDVFFNFLSSNITLLKDGNKGAWDKLNILTSSLFVNDACSDTIRQLLIENGFLLQKAIWRQDEDTDMDSLLQKIANLYLSELSKIQPRPTDIPEAVLQYQSLTFCPNVLFSNFPHEFSRQPCSRSFESAVLLADISGFSKFAGEMCLKGPKGLDVLHKVTSDFLGHFVHTVYDYDGDGKLKLQTQTTHQYYIIFMKSMSPL